MIVSLFDPPVKDRYGWIVAQIAKFPVTRAVASCFKAMKKKALQATSRLIQRSQWLGLPVSGRRRTAACVAE